MIDIFRLSVADFWSKKIILLSILPFLLSVLVFGFSAYFASVNLTEFIIDTLSGWGYEYFDLNEYGFFQAITEGVLFKWIFYSIIYALVAYFVLVASVFSSLIIVGFLTPIVVKEINLRHYNIDVKNPINFMFITKSMCAILIKFIFIFIACLPFLFLPFVNFIIISVPFFYLYYKFLLIDVGSNILNEIKFKIAYLENGGFFFMLSCLVFYAMCLIPIVGLFFQLFFIIFLTHLLARRYVLKI
ncbi:EI24 domain-containing protein [Campylobacter pinnipediorum]|uniref:EI24 domain-containing protein n=1 Tax=Campylobacter pinnipediorum TaxID=1965231 RepID=UPI0009949E19|nr:EI24 domain-containing protein [Campylobacter pinnipediorum]AQW82950.1 putative membrane protein (EI24 domain) [Campylobacter pinnipediorum subsp. pinnipediorum]